MRGQDADTHGLYVHPLSHVRANRGWTHQDVVDIVARRMGNAAARREKAWRWEHWNVVPDRASQLALAAELGVPVEHVSQSPWPCWLPDGDPIHASYAWSQAGSLEALDDAVEHGVLERRGFMALSAAALAGLAADWMRLEPTALVAVLRGGRVTSAFVDCVEEGLPRLRLLEATRGGMRVRQLIAAELGIVADVLANSAYTAEIGKRLYGLAGELGRMVGWACFDAGLHAAAQRYWIAAIHAAHAAGDRPLGANILKSMSLQCYDFSRPAEALALAQSAHEGAGGEATPRTLAMLTLREARAHAALGDTRACERLLGDAENAMSRAGDDNDPAWIGYFDTAEFYAQSGTCYLDLGTHHPDRKRFTRADTCLADTLRLLPEAKVRDRATYLTRRASAQTLLGNLDQACDLMASAVPLIETAPSRRNIQRILKAREQIPFTERDTRGRELDMQLSVLKTAS